MPATQSLSINDVWYRWLQTQLTAGVFNGTVAPTPAGAGAVGTTFQPQSNDAYVTGTPYAAVTAPTAGQAIISLTAPPAGLYTVKVLARITTGINASLADNITIKAGGTDMRRIVHTIVGATSNLFLGEYTQDFRVTGAQAITVSSVALEAAGVVYGISIHARKIAD